MNGLERGMQTIVEKISMPESTSNQVLKSQLEKHFFSLHDKLLNGTPLHTATENDRAAEKSLEYALSVMERNNKMVAIINSEEFVRIKNAEGQLKGPCDISEIDCLDGRFDRSSESFTENTWEVSAAMIEVERRLSDGKLIPQSTKLCEGLRRRFERAYQEDGDHQLLELVLAHSDSTDNPKDPHFGCAAHALTIKALTTQENALEDAKSKEEAEKAAAFLNDKHQLEQKLSKDDIAAILKKKQAHDSHTEALERTTGEAITNVYNSLREEKGLKPLSRVCVVARYDTATMGIVLKQDGEELATSDLTNKNKDQIEDFAKEHDLSFGLYRDKFQDPEHFVELSKNVLLITRELMKDTNGKFTSINEEINNYLKKHLDELTDYQKQALKFKLLRKTAWQFLTGLSNVPDEGPSHPFARHNEAYISVSDGGRFLGKYDSLEQQFGSSPAGKVAAEKQIEIALLVMNKYNLKANKPRILFLNSSLNLDDYLAKNRDLQRIRANNAEFLIHIIRDPQLGKLIKEGKLIPIPVILEEESRAVLEIPDHSVYF